jgi:hypothetical protein
MEEKAANHAGESAAGAFSGFVFSLFRVFVIGSCAKLLPSLTPWGASATIHSGREP